MTDIPNGLYWSKDEAEKALAKHTFIRVSKSDKRSMRQITGAERVWSIPENRDEIYIAAFRVSGKPEDIKVALSSAGYSADTISKYLSSAITVENYKHSPDYKKEMNNLKLYKSEEKERKEKSQVSWETLIEIAANVKEAHVVMKERPKTPGKKGRGATLVDKYKDIHNHESELLNVSDMRDDGTNARWENKPKTTRGRNVFIDEVKIMSRNEEKYLKALEMLFNADRFESESDYQNAINAISAKFAEKRRKGK